MDAIMIFDCDNYLIFSESNQKFLEEIALYAYQNKLIQTKLGNKIKKTLANNSKELENIIVLILAPLIAAIRVLGNCCPPIDIFQSSPNNVRILHTQYLEYIFIYISDLNSYVNLKQMKRRLDMFVEITNLLFGVSLCDLKSDQEQARLLTLVYKNWIASKSFPNIVLEAVECLMVSSNIQTTFANLLQSILAKMRSRLSSLSEEIPAHALLFVDNKLLARISSHDTPKIIESDWVLITLLMDTLYLNIKSDSLKEYDQFLSVFSSEDYDGDDDDSDVDFLDNKFSIGDCKECSKSQVIEHHHQVNFEFKDMDQRLIFLHSFINTRYLVPFYFRLIKVCDKICLVLLSHLSRSCLSFHIQSLLTIINSLQYRPKELRCFHTLDEFDISIKILKQLLKFKIRKQTDETKLLINKLEQINSSDIRKHILSINEKDLSTQLDALCSSFCSSLRNVYSQTVYQHFITCLNFLSNDIMVQKTLNEIKSGLKLSIRDYLDYLLVKSQRNVSVEAYCDIIPGLISFIFVDRTLNQIIIAKNDHQDDNLNDLNFFNLNISLHLLPQLIELAYNDLASGKLFTNWTENEFSMNYLMWFEAENGKPLKAINPCFELESFPSLICNNFIERIKTKCFLNQRKKPIIHKNESIFCYELFYIQKSSLVQNLQAINQAKRLASRVLSITSYSSHQIFSSVHLYK